MIPQLFRTIRPERSLIQKTSKYLCRHSTSSTIYDKSDNLPVPSTGSRPGKVYQPLYDHGEYKNKAQMEQPQFTIPGTTHYEMPEHLKEEKRKSK